MYPGYLRSYYSEKKNIDDLAYNDLYNDLLHESTEFVASYVKGFRKLDIDADFVLANDSQLQNKWATEHSIKVKDDLLLSQVKAFQPDILWIDNLSYVSRDWIDIVRKSVPCIKLVAGYHCSPYGQKILDTLKAVDFVLTCTPGIKLDMESKGLRTWLVYHAFDEELLRKIKPVPDPLTEDFVFSGSLISGSRFHDERIKLIETILDAKIDISLYVNLEKTYKIKLKQFIFHLNSVLNKLKMDRFANKLHFLEHGRTKVENYSGELLLSTRNPVFGIEMLNLFRNSKIVLNMHIGVAGNYAGNMRLFEVTGVGSCLLTDDKQNIKELFEPGKEIITYNGPRDCINKAKWLLDHDDERRDIALAGHERTLQSHTVNRRCEYIAGILEAELKRKQ
jgi:hypothetical protein